MFNNNIFFSYNYYLYFLLLFFPLLLIFKFNCNINKLKKNYNYNFIYNNQNKQKYYNITQLLIYHFNKKHNKRRKNDINILKKIYYNKISFPISISFYNLLKRIRTILVSENDNDLFDDIFLDFLFKQHNLRNYESINNFLDLINYHISSPLLKIVFLDEIHSYKCPMYINKEYKDNEFLYILLVLSEVYYDISKRCRLENKKHSKQKQKYISNISINTLEVFSSIKEIHNKENDLLLLKQYMDQIFFYVLFNYFFYELIKIIKKNINHLNEEILINKKDALKILKLYNFLLKIKKIIISYEITLRKLTDIELNHIKNTISIFFNNKKMLLCFKIEDKFSSDLLNKYIYFIEKINEDIYTYQDLYLIIKDIFSIELYNDIILIIKQYIVDDYSIDLNILKKLITIISQSYLSYANNSSAFICIKRSKYIDRINDYMSINILNNVKQLIININNL